MWKFANTIKQGFANLYQSATKSTTTQFVRKKMNAMENSAVKDIQNCVGISQKLEYVNIKKTVSTNTHKRNTQIRGL